MLLNVAYGILNLLWTAEHGSVYTRPIGEIMFEADQLTKYHFEYTHNESLETVWPGIIIIWDLF